MHSREPEPTDAALLAAHVAGDPAAFGALFRRHRPRLLNAARRRGAGAQDAEDALQEAMLSAHRAAGTFRHEAAVGSWLHRIALNACTDVMRRRGERPLPVHVESAAVVPDPTGRIETTLLIRQALLRLPVEQRAAVVAVDMHGYSVADAAVLLNVAEGTVKSRCSRARKRLSVLLGHTGNNPAYADV